MIEWYQVISYSLTNGIRIFLCLLIITALLNLQKIEKYAIWMAIGLGIVIEVLHVFAIPYLLMNAIEVLAILAIVYLQYHYELRICAFLIIFFEIAVGLWDFLISAGLAMLFSNHIFMYNMTYEHITAVWIVRFLMIGFAAYIAKQGSKATEKLYRTIAITAVVGMFCAIALTEQSIVPLSGEQSATWVILSVILLMSVLFYKLNRQYDMEKEIVRLKTEQMELMECDYQNLNNTYSANARLYHDLHNHLEILYSYILQGQNEEALNYINDLRTPIEKITQGVWTGQEAVDYLINSKLAVADHYGIETKINIEFPHHTNIKNTDLVAILGNLLDNAIEAMVFSNETPRLICLTMRRINDMLIIKVENSCMANPDIIGTEIKTTKSNDELHGWGLKSARAAAERYDGTLEISYTNNRFCIVVVLSFEAI